MKQVLFFTLIGYAACGVFTRYPSTIGVTNQYGSPGIQNPISPNQQIPILRLDANNQGHGTYSFAYETGNGISAQEQGDARGDGTRAQGGFSYTLPNGQLVQLQYTADENGFLPQGSHLPVSLTGPILRSIQQNLEEERKGISDDGQYRVGQQQKYTYSQQQSVPLKQNIPQKYSIPSRYTTPQRYQQHRSPESTQSQYNVQSNYFKNTGYKY